MPVPANQWYVKSIEDKIVTLLDAALSQDVIRAFDSSDDIAGNQVVVNCRAGGNYENNANIYIVNCAIKLQYYMPDDEAGSAADTFIYTAFNTIRQWTAGSFTGLNNVTIDGLVHGGIAYEDLGKQYEQNYALTFYVTVS
jgi:hypothetical protein